MLPFLKWAGGKRWLIAGGYIPQGVEFERYVDPFLGGGAIFFALKPENSILSDVNIKLINLYQVIRDFPMELYRTMILHQERHSKEYYYLVRSQNLESNIERAARMLYLNRTCWNGLYRVNKKGRFNVPIGTKDSVIFPTDDFLKWSAMLKSADISSCDFEETIEKTRRGDLLFVDPPYVTQHIVNGFVKYNQKLFSWMDQVRLSQALSRAARRGVSIIVTNADHESIRELYGMQFRYRKIERASVIAGLARNRCRMSEAMFIANVA